MQKELKITQKRVAAAIGLSERSIRGVVKEMKSIGSGAFASFADSS
jgi:plasmid maintenance system antidote protein VapI